MFRHDELPHKPYFDVPNDDSAAMAQERAQQSARAHRQDADRFGTLQPYVIRVCGGDDCGVRYPVAEAAVAYETCHLCGAETSVVDRVERHDGTTTEPARRSLIAVLDNLRSAMNVGTIIRTADGLGIPRLYMGGISPAVDNPKVIKTALGAESTVECSHHPNLVPVVEQLIADGVTVWALEATPTSVPIEKLAPPALDSPLAIIVGNEIAGVDPGLLSLAHAHVHLPMHGLKNSLNVAVAFGMAAHHLHHT